MKKQLFSLGVIVATITITGLNLSRNNAVKTSDIILENINAIAYGERFSWDGREWNDTNTDHWFGQNWKPVLTKCSVTVGIPGIYQVTTEGQKVTCNYGNGNCLMPSDCTNG